MEENYRKLDDEEINEELSKLDKWVKDENKIKRTFEFKDFADAFTFMTRMAIEIEKINRGEKSIINYKDYLYFFYHKGAFGNTFLKI